MAVAGAKFDEPALKKAGLPWTQELVKKWEKDVPVRHRPPAVFLVVAAAAVSCRRAGRPRVALLLLIGTGCWPRPGELVEFTGEDVQLPESLFLSGPQGCALLKVAPGGGPPKGGRPQPAYVMSPPVVSLHALRALTSLRKRSDEALGGVSYFELRDAWN